MNARLRELESQCWEAKPYGPPWFDSKKFAKLLISDVLIICENAGDAGLDGHHCADEIVRKYEC